MGSWCTLMNLNRNFQLLNGRAYGAYLRINLLFASHESPVDRVQHSTAQLKLGGGWPRRWLCA